jgi:hypothetical protein
MESLQRHNRKSLRRRRVAPVRRNIMSQRRPRAYGGEYMEKEVQERFERIERNLERASERIWGDTPTS